MIGDGSNLAKRHASGGSALPKLIGLLCALCSLAASVLGKVEPGTALIRAAIAFAIGSLLTQAWYVFIATRITTVDELVATSDKETTANDQEDRRAA
jgi:hypothetical protein